MKFRITAVGAGALGLGALTLRVLEYYKTLDGEGFYLMTPLASTLKAMLTVVLAVGLIYCIFAPFGVHKEQAELSALYGTDLLPRILFALMGLCVGIHGALRLTHAATTLEKTAAALFLLGALGWLWMGRSPKRAGLMTLLPTVGLGAEIIRYFWTTYKYIHISAYILGMLGLCVMLMFTFSLAKGLTASACSKHRLAMSGGWALLFLPAAFMAPLVKDLSAEALLSAAEALILVFLAVYSILCLERRLLQPEEVEEPDLSELNAFLDTIPDPEEE